MKKLKTLIAAFMAATMVLTMTGCDEEAGPDVGGGGGGSTPTQGNSTPAAGGDNTSGGTTSVDRKDMEDEAVTEAAKALADKVSYPDLKVTKRIKWMAWWDMDETSGEAELFKEVYGIPETGDDPKSDGRIFEYTLVDYAARFDRLSTSIANDEQPDLFPFEIDDFPYGIYMNRYNSVDSIIDFNSEKWAPTKSLNDQFMLNGKHYASFYTYTIMDLLWYRKSNIESIGAEDPQKLFFEGKWDWDAFLDMAQKWQKTGDNKYAVDGWAVDTDFIVSTGVPIIGSDGTKLVSNLRTAEVERATDFLATLQQQNLRYPRHELNEWQYYPLGWGKDEILFFADGTWRYEEDLQVYKKKYKWPADDIGVVPFPKDPQVDKYYVQMKVDIPMWVRGSKNAEGVQAWLDCCVTTAQDKALHEASNAKAIKNPKMGYTQEILDFLDLLYGYEAESPITPIVEFKKGLGTTFLDENNQPVMAGLLFPIYLTGDSSFTQVRDQWESAILARMNDINSKL